VVTVTLADRARFTEIYPVDSYVLPEASIYVSGRSGEDRSQHATDLASRCPSSSFVEVEDTEPGRITVVDGADRTVISLRSSSDLEQFWRHYELPPYLDITGLTHSTWASLLRGAFMAETDISVVYVEPMRYRFNRIRTEGELFDLSVKFDGIGPLPGFLSLAEPHDDDVLFVPMLGFEGPRFSMVLNHVETPRDRIHPIVGVPGFRPEFVYYAYQGNRLPLEETESWMAVKYAAANCPFSAFYALEEISAQNQGAFMRVAPIGTKPHGLGAVLFALAHPDEVELIYDHPVRREGRTAGTARLLVYHVSALSGRMAL
jgi:hypothetical protein